MLYINTHILQKDMKLKIPKKLVDLLSLTKDKIKFNIYFDSENQSIILKKVTEEQSQFFQDLSNDSDVLIKKQLSIESSLPQEKICNKVVKFVDLFAGLGGLRLGFEQAFHEKGFKTKCILTSEIKPYAIQALRENFQQDNLQGDIKKISSSEIEDFDFLLAGFPCQSFSTAGKGLGFLDTRGTLFFEIERILREKNPYGFILENVEGLILHDREKKSDSIGRTLQTILYSLEKLGYNVQWKLLECQKFGVPQQRKRIFIVGTKKNIVSLDHFQEWSQVVGDILEHNQPIVHSHFTECLMKNYSIEKLYGKAIKDKRGGKNNIHSWDISLKGDISLEQKKLMECLLKERRKKHWAEELNIPWMDGMPLTLEQISTFYHSEHLKEMLDDLVQKKYLVLEHPKNIVVIKKQNGLIQKERQQDTTKPKGYNIVTGKLSFEFTKILNPNEVAPTLVATDISHIGVIDGDGIRKLTIREGLRLFGYPENYNLSMFKNKELSKAFDLLGNTVAIPVVKSVASKLCEVYCQYLS